MRAFFLFLWFCFNVGSNYWVLEGEISPRIIVTYNVSFYIDNESCLSEVDPEPDSQRRAGSEWTFHIQKVSALSSNSLYCQQLGSELFIEWVKIMTLFLNSTHKEEISWQLKHIILKTSEQMFSSLRLTHSYFQQRCTLHCEGDSIMTIFQKFHGEDLLTIED